MHACILAPVTPEQPTQLHRVLAALGYPIGALFGPMPPLLVLLTTAVTGHLSEFLTAHLFQSALRSIWIAVAALVSIPFFIAAALLQESLGSASLVTRGVGLAGGAVIFGTYFGVTLMSVWCALRAYKGRRFRTLLVGRIAMRDHSALEQ